MTEITPIENKDAEQAVIAILAEQVRMAKWEEHSAWRAYIASRSSVATPLTAAESDELRNRWIHANGALQAVYATAVKVCEEIGAGWREMFDALHSFREE